MYSLHSCGCSTPSRFLLYWTLVPRYSITNTFCDGRIQYDFGMLQNREPQKIKSCQYQSYFCCRNGNKNAKIVIIFQHGPFILSDRRIQLFSFCIIYGLFLPLLYYNTLIDWGILKSIPVLKFTQYNLFHFIIWLDLGAEIETTTCIEKIYDDKLEKFESKWVIIDLFDVTQKCHTSHGPMPGTNVTFKVNWTNVVQICSSWFSVNWALIQFWVFTSCCVNGIDINYRHLFIQNFWPWFH